MPRTGDEGDNLNEQDPTRRGDGDGGDGAGDPGKGAGGADGTRIFENAKTPSVQGPTFAAAEPRVEDVSDKLIQALPRQKGETIKCRRISGDHYRCNWWGRREPGGYDNPGLGGLLVTTHRVVRSQVVRARMTPAGLVIEPQQRQ